MSLKLLSFIWLNNSESRVSPRPYSLPCLGVIKWKKSSLMTRLSFGAQTFSPASSHTSMWKTFGCLYSAPPSVVAFYSAIHNLEKRNVKLTPDMFSFQIKILNSTTWSAVLVSDVSRDKKERAVDRIASGPNSFWRKELVEICLVSVLRNKARPPSLLFTSSDDVVFRR